MALTNLQRQRLLELKAQGLTKEQALVRLFRIQPEAQSEEGRFADVGEDLKSSFLGVGEDLYSRGQYIREGFQAGARGEQTPLETGAQMAGNILGGAGDIAFRGLQAGVTPFLKESEERKIEDKATELLQPVSDYIGEQSPRAQRNIIGGLGLLEGATAGVTAATFKPAISRVKNFFSRTKPEAPTQPKPTLEPEQAVEQLTSKVENRLNEIANDPNISAKEKFAAAESSMSIRERMAGVTPDVKKRIQEMPPGTLERYFDQAHLRNVSDTELTPYALGSQRASESLEGLNTLLRDSGSQIGETRTKLANVKMQQTSVEAIEGAFRQELDRLNLRIKNGQVSEVPGKIAKVSSNSDINTLNDLYSDLLKYKQSPTLANAIDLRMKFDGKIKFGKSAREVSGDVDPVSRTVRRIIAEETAKKVGTSNAAELQRYSDFMEAYADLKSFTDRAAGGEYLLRLVLSGRGAEAQKLVQTIKEYTGIDLMNDATAMKLATEIIGNDSQKNLFRQEVTKAGLDAARLFQGDVGGVTQVALQRLADFALDQETIYRAIAAGTISYMVLTYVDEEGVIAPAGLAILAAMPDKARKEAIEEAIKVAKTTGKNTDELQKYIDTPPKLESGKTQSATTKTTDLLEEAKKYKSADEFVNSPNILKHVSEVDVVKPDNRGVLYFTDSAEYAQKYGRGASKNTSYVDINDLTVLDGTSNKGKNLVKSYAKENDLDEAVVFDDIGNVHHSILKRPKFVEYAKKQGFDAVKVSESYADDGVFSIGVLKPEGLQIKTRTQLEDIWKQANKTDTNIEKAVEASIPNTKTPAFKNWFGKSKVVDENGEPLVLYHGTSDKIDEFSHDYAGMNTANNEAEAFYFTNEKVVADDYGRQSFIRKVEDRTPEEIMEMLDVSREEAVKIADEVAEVAEENIRTVPAYVKMENPLIIEPEVARQLDIYTENPMIGGDAINTVKSQEVVDFAKGKGSELSEGLASELYENDPDLFYRTFTDYDESMINDYKDKIKQYIVDNELYDPEIGDPYTDINEVIDSDVRDYAPEALDSLGVLNKKEFDGVIFREVIDNIGDESNVYQDVYVVFEPTQIKHIENTGKFSEVNPNIFYGIGGAILGGGVATQQ